MALKQRVPGLGNKISSPAQIESAGGLKPDSKVICTSAAPRVYESGCKWLPKVEHSQLSYFTVNIGIIPRDWPARVRGNIDV